MNICEDVKRRVVVVDGISVAGHVDHGRACRVCGSTRIYHDDFDAYFCAVCNAWLETACTDSACDYCAHRPARPLSGGQRPVECSTT